MLKKFSSHFLIFIKFTAFVSELLKRSQSLSMDGLNIFAAMGRLIVLGSMSVNGTWT